MLTKARGWPYKYEILQREWGCVTCLPSCVWKNGGHVLTTCIKYLLWQWDNKTWSWFKLWSRPQQVYWSLLIIVVEEWIQWCSDGRFTKTCITTLSGNKTVNQNTPSKSIWHQLNKLLLKPAVKAGKTLFSHRLDAKDMRPESKKDFLIMSCFNWGYYFTCC